MSETIDNLNWSAFRYIGNELDATEASEFESLLLTDQGAREAVANAVEETTQIRRALAGDVVVTAASQRSNWNRKTTQVAVVAAASCLTLLLALCLVLSLAPIPGNVADQGSENELSISPAQLAYAWVEARVASTELQPVVDAEPAETLDSVLTAPLDAEAEQSLVAPSWMIAALAKMDGGIDSNLEIQE